MGEGKVAGEVGYGPMSNRWLGAGGQVAHPTGGSPVPPGLSIMATAWLRR